MGEVLLPIKPKFTFRAADGYPPHCGIKLDTWDNHFSGSKLPRFSHKTLVVSNRKSYEIP